MIKMSSADAKNHFGELLDKVQEDAVLITRHGRPSAVLLSARELQAFAAFQESRQRRKNALADFQELFSRSDGQRSPRAETLTDADIRQLVKDGH